MVRSEVWADVGGTFTDCFVVSGGSRRSMKVLSSGRVRARVVEVDGQHIVVDDALQDVAGFWCGAKARFIRHRSADPSLRTMRVSGFDCGSRTLTFDGPVPAVVMAGDTLELDAALEAPVLAARRLIGVPLSQPLPPIELRLGTTRGTNALLTRTGAEVALLTTAGFGDLLEIGEQTRPQLFELTIRKPQPLTHRVIEVDERLDASGAILRGLDEDALVATLRGVRDAGVASIAVCLLHAHVNDVHERRIGELAEQIGFANISLSSRVAPLIKLVARAETTVLDAYLNPVLGSYLAKIREQLGSEGAGRLRLMTSGGNLVDAQAFRGCDSILSGPAGGVVSLGKIAESYNAPAAIGLDMGGTSTDVSRFEGRVARQYESFKAGVRVLTPMMAIHTVAAGGGSICDVQDGRMTVGPRSAGADPGPACYGRGGPLTVTDLNVVLGRLPVDRFPFPLDVAAARRRLTEVNQRLGEDGFASIEQAAEGFLEIAVAHMAEAVRTVSTAEGSDPRGMTLVGFGGAAGGHLCAIADAIGMTRVIDHRHASLLSALGMGLADVGRVRTSGVYRPLADLNETFWKETLAALTAEVCGELNEEVAPGIDVATVATVHHEADLRYLGTESTLPLSVAPLESLEQRFHAAHRAAFGYDQPHRPVEVAAIRCEAVIASAAPLDVPEAPPLASAANDERTEMTLCGRRLAVPLQQRARLPVGSEVVGPCIIVDSTSTLVIDPHWSATKLASGSFELRKAVATTQNVCGAGAAGETSSQRGDHQFAAERADAVVVEVVARRLQGIADSMGEMLRRTAVSVNIKERLDFSCAVFDRNGTLLANAPHVPVHLGAMGHTVRYMRQVFPEMSAGDVYLSNDPYAGGSHLPDVTVVTPVFCSVQTPSGELDDRHSGQPDFYVASRAHHAEIGGKTPGSMPPGATNLAEEGVVIRALPLRRGGAEFEDQLWHLLTTGTYPSRTPEINLADIAAQRAAGVAGSKALNELVARTGRDVVDTCGERMLEQASAAVGRWIESLGPAPRSFADTLDDGTLIAVRLTPAHGRLAIDFTGTSPVHPRCFNATPAIVTAATLYVLRCLIGGTLPMNGGITSRIDFVIPPGLLNPPPADTPEQCAAVVAGNVETSMRVVDVLLGALGVAAASQGTMNNVLIGDATFGSYETIGGGSGATAFGPGASGVHCHMTNTRITEPEVYESRYPLRLWRFALRGGSGGAGRHAGGDGLIRELEFLRPLTLSLITNRRGDHRPWGLAGGEPGTAGRNTLLGPDGSATPLPAATTIDVAPGERLRLETPGGGGWGAPQ